MGLPLQPESRHLQQAQARFFLLQQHPLLTLLHQEQQLLASSPVWHQNSCITDIICNIQRNDVSASGAGTLFPAGAAPSAAPAP